MLAPDFAPSRTVSPSSGTLNSSLIGRLEGGAAATAAGGGRSLPRGLGRQPATQERPAGRGRDALSRLRRINQALQPPELPTVA